MSQIALVSHQQDDYVGIGMVAQFLEPSCDVLIGMVLADVVHEESAHGTAVVGGCDRAIPFLTSCAASALLTSAQGL